MITIDLNRSVTETRKDLKQTFALDWLLTQARHPNEGDYYIITVKNAIFPVIQLPILPFAPDLIPGSI